MSDLLLPTSTHFTFLENKGQFIESNAIVKYNIYSTIVRICMVESISYWQKLKMQKSTDL